MIPLTFAVQRWALGVLGGAVLLGLAVWVHSGWVDDAKDRAVAAYAAKVEQKALKIQRDAERISAAIRSKTDEANRRSDADARDLLVRGPGRAACVASPAAGRPVAPGGSADAAVDTVPDPVRVELIGVPYVELVERGRLCDANRTEVMAWREQYEKAGR